MHRILSSTKLTRIQVNNPVSPISTVYRKQVNDNSDISYPHSLWVNLSWERRSASLRKGRLGNNAKFHLGPTFEECSHLCRPHILRNVHSSHFCRVPSIPHFQERPPPAQFLRSHIFRNVFTSAQFLHFQECHTSAQFLWCRYRQRALALDYMLKFISH